MSNDKQTSSAQIEQQRRMDNEFRTIDSTRAENFNIARHGNDVAADRNGVRLYHASPSAWNLQVRGPVGRGGKVFAIATSAMSREDLEWLRERITEVLACEPA